MLSLSTPVESITPLAKKYKTDLTRLGIETVRDLLWHLPVRYEDFSVVNKIDDAVKDEAIVIVGKVVSVAVRRSWKSKKSITEAILEDDTGQIKAIWFNQRFISKVLTQGSVFYFSGKVIDFYGLTLSNPTHERYDEQSDSLHFGKLTPIYPSSGKLTQKLLRFFTMSALKKDPNIVENVDKSYLAKEGIYTLPEAVKEIHFPDAEENIEKAIYRLKFEELLQVQQKSRELKKRLERLPAHPLKAQKPALEGWVLTLPFTLTDGQNEAILEISEDIEKSFPMTRLLQGEVGSGKTVVAAIALLQSYLAGAQGAVMAPTEVLASQHFTTFKKLFNDSDISICLLTRTSKLIAKHGHKAESTKDAIKRGVKAGTVDIIIGTHALIQKEIEFSKMGIIVIDEQQRFGVKQRIEILKKNKDDIVPHMLALTATPIPRTYTHFLYGALDVSLLEELPSGRKKVKTKLVKRSEIKEVYEAMHDEIACGRQVFIICPVIMESDSLGVEAVITEEEKIKNEFPKASIDVLHGRQTGVAKEKAMLAFVKGKTDILISTAVVEVGIDVPNATIMFIESPERFGLAQLHQFRGRVGRGDAQSYCFIVAEDTIAKENERLKLFNKIDNGFELSEKDLLFRGSGELYGLKQSGFLHFKIATLRDVEIMKKVKEYLKSRLV